MQCKLNCITFHFHRIQFHKNPSSITECNKEKWFAATETPRHSTFFLAFHGFRKSTFRCSRSFSHRAVVVVVVVVVTAKLMNHLIVLKFLLLPAPWHGAAFLHRWLSAGKWTLVHYLKYNLHYSLCERGAMSLLHGVIEWRNSHPQHELSASSHSWQKERYKKEELFQRNDLMMLIKLNKRSNAHSVIAEQQQQMVCNTADASACLHRMKLTHSYCSEAFAMHRVTAKWFGAQELISK